jgi:hypothetical protein
MCGRLRCCLVYEYEQYVAARKELPKRNKRVVTPRGEGKVVDVMPMSNTVLVLLDNDERHYPVPFDREELQPWDELEALRRKSEAPCDRHEGGECTCGKDKKESSEKDTESQELKQKPKQEQKPQQAEKRKPEYRERRGDQRRRPPGRK